MTDCDHSTLETPSEEEGIPVLPTEPASNDDCPIAVIENLEVNNDIIEEEATKIVQSMCRFK